MSKETDEAIEKAEKAIKEFREALQSLVNTIDGAKEKMDEEKKLRERKDK